MSTLNTEDEVENQPFTEEDLQTLRKDPTSPSHPLMKLIAQLTLHKLSPFKLAPSQTPSYADFLAHPWPKTGEDVDNTVNNLLRKFRSVCSNLHWSRTAMEVTAEGLSVVIGTSHAFMQHKLAGFLRGNPVDIQTLCWEWDETKRQALTTDFLARAMANEAVEWHKSAIRLLLEAIQGSTSATQDGMTLSRTEIDDLHSTSFRAADKALYKLTSAAKLAAIESHTNSLDSDSSAGVKRSSWFSTWFPSKTTGGGDGAVGSVSSIVTTQRSVNRAQAAAMKDALLVPVNSVGAVRDPSLQSQIDAMRRKLSPAFTPDSVASSSEVYGSSAGTDKRSANA